ncbi:MAG TPA: flagellar hook-associated protein FlgL [Bryocella sp.]|nr:flagellar hook-associated protein FlgL [Bryocella sp.]
MSVRVNPNIIPDLVAGIAQTQQQLNQADQEIASGRSINQPSDNPAGTSALILNHASQSQTDTFQVNVSSLQTRLQTADSALSSAVTAINQAISLGVEAGNSDLSDTDRQAIVSQLSGIQQQLVSIANTSYSGTYLFGGSLVETQPFTLDSSSPSGVTYNGNNSTVSVQVNNSESVATNVPGSQLFLNSSGSVLGAIQGLITAVQNNSGISAASTALGTAASVFNGQRASYDSALTQLQSDGTFLSSEQTQLSTQENNIDAADLASASSAFSQASVAYQSLIEAESTVLQLPNLLTYLQ